MKRLFAITMLAASLALSAQEVLPLYKKIPNSKPAPDTEHTTTDGVVLIHSVSVPTLTVYKPKKQSDKKTAIIVCPGGGYAVLANGHEGTEVAAALNDMGIMVFLLKYRIPNDATMQDKSIGPLQDLQRAIQMVREGAAAYNIDPNKIGVMGFSAGGHLAASGATQFAREHIDNPKHTSLRPDFSMLIYPVISFTDSLTHPGSREQLLGKSPTIEKLKVYSNELQATPQTPPAFLVHSADDDIVPVGNCIKYYEALVKNKVDGEMLLYPHGGHGYGMYNPTTADKWMDNLKNWLIAGNFL